jgi:transcriptional regulator with XRE-family HTH domain
MSIKWPRAIIIAVDSANRTIGIKYFTHPDGRIVAEIPALKQLMRLIARDLVLSKSGLTGGEVRFLRKRLGKKATDYCKYLGLEPETLSRIENGKQTISSATQKLARLSYAILSEEPGLYDHARTILQSMLEELKPAKEKLVLEIGDNSEWREAA